jgi:Protein of unknown function (DUF2917)
MFTDTTRPLQEWQIEQGVALSFNAREVRAITSQLGTLWLTQPGTMSDYFLSAGERFDIAPNAGQIVVEALDRRARVAVSARNAPLVPFLPFAPRVRLRVRETIAATLRRAANWIDAPTAPCAAH